MSTPKVLSCCSTGIFRVARTYRTGAIQTRFRYYSTESGEATLLPRLKSDIKTAMKAKDTMAVNVLKSLLSDITYASKATGLQKDLTTDAELFLIFQKALKRRQESVTLYTAGSRADLAEQEEREAEIVRRYLPQEMMPEEIEQEVRRVVSEVGASGPNELGKVMKHWKVDSVRAPKKVVTDIVRRVLAEN